MDRKSQDANRIRHYRLHGVSLETIAVCEGVPLWEVETICQGPILTSEFEPPHDFITSTGRDNED